MEAIEPPEADSLFVDASPDQSMTLNADEPREAGQGNLMRFCACAIGICLN